MKRIFTFFAALVCVVSMSAKVIYLVPNDWKSDNAALFVHSWGGGSDIAGKMTKVNDNLYQFEIGNNTNCLFIRQSPDLGDQINWDQKWNQTGDLAIPAGKNCYTITGWGENDGTWSTHSTGTPDPDPTPNPDVTTKTIYLVPDAWASDGAKFSVYSIATNSFSGFLTSSDGVHYEATVADNTQIIFVRHDGTATAPTWDNKWNQTDDLTIPAGKDCWKHTTWGVDGGKCQGEWLVYPTSGPTPDPNATYYVTGSAELVGADKAWSATAVAMTKNTDNTFTHTFTDLAAGVVYRMKLTNGTWDANWGFGAVQNAPAGVVGDADGNVVFELKTKGNVSVGFNGSKITVQGDFTEDEPIKPVHGSSVPSECEDVMLQAFYYDSYRDGAPGDVKINGVQLGNTKWSTLLNQSDEIGTYFDLVWLPPSGKSEGGTGYHQTQYSNQNSDWGSQKELLEFIHRMHAAETKVVADIVINHAGCKSSWCDFYPQNFGEYGTFQPDASWICNTDEVNYNPEAGPWQGKATGTDDGGYNMQDNYGSARDWAHAKPEVQEMMKAYLKWMKDVIGFDGWRYDYAQGFKGKYINMYNSAAANYFSVVEFWNGDMNNIKSYLNDVNWNTLAFDFSTKYSAIQGIADGDYTKCKGSGLLGAGLSKFAVTFVDSHDTYFGCQGGRDNNDEIGGCGKSMEDYNKDRVLGANAFILSMPGVPCVFYPHWVKYKDEIGKMVLARKAAGVHSESKVQDEAGNGYYKSTITGKHGSIRLLLGPNSGYNATPQGYKLAYKGGNFAMYYTTTQPEVPVLNITPSTTYKTATYTVEMSAVALSGTPTIYYTMDGSDPTTSATKKTYSGAFTVQGTVTVKACAVLNSVTSAVQEATYTYQEPQQTPLTVKFMPPTTWNKVYLYAWDKAGAVITPAWPGLEWKTKDSEGWLYHIFDAKYQEVNIIFTNNEGEQSSDILLDQDACYEWKGMEVLSQNCSLSDIPFQVMVNPEGKVYKTETMSVTLSTVGEPSAATIYYTLDNTDPRTSSSKKTYSTPITIQGTKTLKAYAVAGAAQTDVVTHTYTYEAPQATPIVVKSKVPTTWTDKITVWVWATGGAGAESVATKQGAWYVYTHANSDEFNIIFKNGEGWNGDTNQTVDITSISKNTCLEITAGEGKAEYTVVDCDSSDVENITISTPQLDFSQPMYNILGQPVNAGYRGIVIQGNNKFIVR